MSEVTDYPLYVPDDRRQAGDRVDEMQMVDDPRLMLPEAGAEVAARHAPRVPDHFVRSTVEITEKTLEELDVWVGAHARQARRDALLRAAAIASAKVLGMPLLSDVDLKGIVDKCQGAVDTRRGSGQTQQNLIIYLSQTLNF